MSWLATVGVVLVSTPWKAFYEAHERSLPAIALSVIGMLTVSLVVWPSILHEILSTIDTFGDDDDEGGGWIEIEIELDDDDDVDVDEDDDIDEV